MSQDYNATLNLPKTEFPMRAGLPKREPEMLKAWQEQDIYREIVKKNEGHPRFNLHDGPPSVTIPPISPAGTTTACPLSPPSSRSRSSTTRP